MREDLYTSGECSALAGLLPGVQGEIPAGRVPHQKVPEMREDLHIPVKRPSLAKILPGMPGEAESKTPYGTSGVVCGQVWKNRSPERNQPLGSFAPIGSRRIQISEVKEREN